MQPESIKFISDYKKASASMEKGLDEYKKENYKKALQLITESRDIYEKMVSSGRLQIEHNLAVSYMNRGVILRCLELYEEASKDYKKAIEIWRDQAEKENFTDLPTLFKCYKNLLILGCTNPQYIENSRKTAEEVINFITELTDGKNVNLSLLEILMPDILDLIIKYDFLPQKYNIEKFTPSVDITFPPNGDALHIMGEIFSAFANQKGFLYTCQIAEKGISFLLARKKEEDALWFSKFWLQVLKDWDYSHKRKEKVIKTIKELEEKGISFRFSEEKINS